MNLRFALLNVQGLVTKRTNKLQTQELMDIFNSNDIVLLTETWTDNSSEVAVSNFEAFILNRVEKKKVETQLRRSDFVFKKFFCKCKHACLHQ